MNTSPIFDPAVYETLASELGATDAAEVLSGFLADTAGKLNRLAANALDREVTRREAHSIKCSSATFGFLEMSRIAQKLEANAREIGPDGLRSAIEELQRSFGQVRSLSAEILSEPVEGIAK